MTEARVQQGGATFFIMLDKVRDGMAAGNTLRGEKKLTLGFRAARSPWRAPMAPSPRCAATERAIRSHKS